LSFQLTSIFKKKSIPAFIIVGAQKAGTTSLFNYLAQHPQLVPANDKEIHFFDGGLDSGVDNFAKGYKWYREQFSHKNNLKSKQLTFEASPLYLFNPLVPGRMYSMLPDLKIIVLLRNPVERAISHYFHECRLGVESLSILEAFEAEEERLSDALNNNDFKSFNYIHFSYKSRGIYSTQLKRYFKYFSEERMHIINSDDLFRNTDTTLKKLFCFLGVDDFVQIANLQPHGVAKKPKVDLPVYDYLATFFQKYNQDLYKLVRRDFYW